MAQPEVSSLSTGHQEMQYSWIIRQGLQNSYYEYTERLKGIWIKFKNLEACEENKQWNKIMKTVQDMKIEKEPLKKTQTKIKQEMKTLGSQTKTWGKPGQCSIRHGRETIIEGKVREIAMSVKKNVASR